MDGWRCQEISTVGYPKRDAISTPDHPEEKVVYKPEFVLSKIPDGIY